MFEIVDAARETAPRHDRGTVLIVDDLPVNIDVLVALLKADFDIAVASSGAEALERVEIVKPDLILLDVMMPAMDGFKVCTRLKASGVGANIPVISSTTPVDIWPVMSA